MEDLLLPGHRECCLRPLLAWMQRWLPQVPLSLRAGYLPCWRAHRHPELTRPLDREAGKQALELAADYGLTVID